MKKLFVRENEDGRYHLENFGPEYSKEDGKGLFGLVIESKSKDLVLEFPEVSVFDLFTRFDFKDIEFRQNRFRCVDFVRIKQAEKEYLVEARSGTLYDFFKERAANGRCQLESAKPLSFYFRGSIGSSAA